jgi:hypothetical protein
MLDATAHPAAQEMIAAAKSFSAMTTAIIPKTARSMALLSALCLPSKRVAIAMTQTVIIPKTNPAWTWSGSKTG